MINSIGVAIIALVATAYLGMIKPAQAQFLRPFSATPLPSTMLQNNGALEGPNENGVYLPKTSNQSMMGADPSQSPDDKAATAQQQSLEREQNADLGDGADIETCTRPSDEPLPAMDVTYGGNEAQKTKKDPCAPKSQKADKQPATKSVQQHTSNMEVGTVISGKASVISGDTLRVNGTTIHLAGIEAPPPGEVCRSASTAWDCGIEATSDLQNVADQRFVTCSIQAEKSDVVGKSMPEATCTGASGIKDLSIFQAIRGNALGTALETKTAMRKAKTLRVGIWTTE